ncbi:MAG: type II secretion system protein [Candidatus Gracilibacteria bacterium]|nr:type II secretion system protein [Candidatus Gracilibacteria bacterium]
MRNTKNAFTLVELIVVITILAILGTIAFISLQGYSADARNSKRTSDIGNIQSAISLKQVEGVPLLSFVAENVNALSGGLDIGGSIGVLAASGAYAAGTPSYTVLNVIEKDFKDPKSDKAYRIGATTRAGGVFQVAAVLEQDGDETNLVNGTYAARTATGYTGTPDGTTFSLEDENANRFKVGDVVNGGRTVDKVSRDGVTLTLSSSYTGTTLTLANDESAGLIGSTADKTKVVKNLDTTDLAY